MVENSVVDNENGKHGKTAKQEQILEPNLT